MEFKIGDIVMVVDPTLNWGHPENLLLAFGMSGEVINIIDFDCICVKHNHFQCPEEIFIYSYDAEALEKLPAMNVLE